MNLITIAGRTIDVQKIAAIEWPDTGRQYTRLIFAVPLTSDQPYDMRLSEAQTEAFRWYLARIWQPVDIERAYQLRPEGRPPPSPPRLQRSTARRSSAASNSPAPPPRTAPQSRRRLCACKNYHEIGRIVQKHVRNSVDCR